MRKALITGVSGQDGAYLCKFLKDKGYLVIGISRKKDSEDNFAYLGSKPHIMYYGDVSETDFINHVIGKERPDEIYNLAAQSHVGVSFKSPLTTMQVNYGGLVNIINAVKLFATNSKIYQAGTSEMFGYASVEGEKQNEETPFKPMSPYAISKVAAHMAGINARREGVWVSNGILFNHESPIRGEDFVTRKITLSVAKGKTPTLGDLTSKRDWGFAGDYVEGMWLMLQHDKPDDFVLATGEMNSVSDFLSLACNYADVKYSVDVSIDNYRPNDLRTLCGDASKAKQVLGWKPKTGFRDLVKLMVTEDMKRFGYERVKTA